MSLGRIDVPTTHVLIPGGGHGGWAWFPVARRLRAAGHDALPITLPGMGSGEDPGDLHLADAIGAVVDEVVRRDLTDVVLVGHSLGGIVLSDAAARLTGRVAELVYVSAHVPVPAQSFADARAAQDDPPSAAADATSDTPGGLSFDAFSATLMPGEPEPARRIVFELLTPTPPRYVTDPYDGPAPVDLGIPSRYVLARDDIALALPGAELAARLGVEPVLVPGTHEALLTHPDEVAAAILGRD